MTSSVPLWKQLRMKACFEISSADVREALGIPDSRFIINRLEDIIPLAERLGISMLTFDRAKHPGLHSACRISDDEARIWYINKLSRIELEEYKYSKEGDRFLESPKDRVRDIGLSIMHNIVHVLLESKGEYKHLDGATYDYTSTFDASEVHVSDGKTQELLSYKETNIFMMGIFFPHNSEVLERTVLTPTRDIRLPSENKIYKMYNLPKSLTHYYMYTHILNQIKGTS